MHKVCMLSSVFDANNEKKKEKKTLTVHQSFKVVSKNMGLNVFKSVPRPVMFRWARVMALKRFFHNSNTTHKNQESILLS